MVCEAAMSLTMAQLEYLAECGLTLAQVIELGRLGAVKSGSAERQRRYRERKADVTRDVTRDVTPLPETKVSPEPPSKTQPTPTPSPPKGGSVPTNLAFARFWQAYPRKVGKADARKAFDKACHKLAPEEITGALERAKAAWTDPQFIPHPATWLNGERWEDEPEALRPAPLSGFAKWQLATGRA